jgi:Skp family chaperone for outer membrane proteins
MDFLKQYLNRANEIIGDRTKEEERYDKEVLRWLRKGKGIQKAINKANQKYPNEALEVVTDNVNDVAAHYDYLLEHDNIIRKISH